MALSGGGDSKKPRQGRRSSLPEQPTGSLLPEDRPASRVPAGANLPIGGSSGVSSQPTMPGLGAPRSKQGKKGKQKEEKQKVEEEKLKEEKSGGWSAHYASAYDIDARRARAVAAGKAVAPVGTKPKPGQTRDDQSQYKPSSGYKSMRPVLALAMLGLVSWLVLWPGLKARNRAEQQIALDLVMNQQLALLVEGQNELVEWMQDSDYDRMSALFMEKRPSIVDAVQKAGFPDTSVENIKMRFDAKSSALELVAFFEQETDEASAMAAKARTAPEGKAPPPIPPEKLVAPSLAETLSDDMVVVVTAYLGCAILIFLMWFPPSRLMGRS